MNEISPIDEKKVHDHRRKAQENYNFLTKQSPFLSPNFIRGSTVIVIPHKVELCKQHFLQEYLLLIRKSCSNYCVIAFMEKGHCIVGITGELKLVKGKKHRFLL